jgi:hypothetical protein
MLKNKTVLLVGLLFILIFIYFFISKETKNNSLTPDDRLKPHLQNQTKSKVKESIPKKANQKQLKILDSSSQVYNEDPAVDSLIALTLFRECIKYFKPVKSIGVFTVVEKKYSEKQQTYIDTYHQHCEQLKKKQPQYFDKDIYTIIMQLNKKPIVNELGQLISNTINPYANYDNIDIPKSLKLIKQSHPDVMILGYKLLGLKYKAEILVPDIKAFLGSSHSKYVDSVIEYGQLLYACNHGANCSQNSGVLIQLCQSNEDFCLNSFDEILSNKISEGQRNDILLVEQYFSQLYDDQ